MRIFLALLLPFLTAFAQEHYYPFSVDQDRLAGAADFAFLNHPIGAADRLFVRDGHFCRAGADLKAHTADDERVRLFGTNMCFGANFPEESDAPRVAKRLRRLGVNLLRLHHMDTSPDRNPDEARSILTTGPYPTLNPVSVVRLRSFLAALKSEGIYVNLNLHVGYVFRPSVDAVPALPEGLAMPNQGKPLHIFYPRMIDLQTEYAHKLIGALSLKGDPVLGMVEIDNESSLLEAWQRGNLDRYAMGEYRAELEKQWNTFLRSKYPSTDAVRQVWGIEIEGQTLESGNIQLVQSKEAGPQKRADDYLLFLCDRDRYYLRRMREAIHAAADKLVPVAGTQMGYGGLQNLDSHADLDYQDNHFYIDHYNFPKTPWDARDWRIRDSSTVGSGLTSFISMAAAREAGKPYTVSEFNQPWPNRQAAEIDPTLAAFAAFQDWDSIMHFAYEHRRSWDAKVPSGFNVNGDWTKFPNIGQSAWLFRSGAIQPGKFPLRIQIAEDLQLQAGREKRLGNIIGALTAALGYDPACALVHPVSLAKGKQSALPEAGKGPGASSYRSDTGELLYHKEQKLMLVQAPKAAGIFGFIGAGSKVTAGAMALELEPGSRGFVSVLLTSLDGQPIEKSGCMLLSIPGYTLGTQPGTNPPRPQKLINHGTESSWWTLEPESNSMKPSGNLNGGSPPVWMERVECRLTLRSSASGLKVYPLDAAGGRLKSLGPEAVTRVAGGVRVHLQGDDQEWSPWYEIAK